MATTRRDLVKTLAAVPAVSLLPATASTAASPVTTAGSEVVHTDELAAYKAAWDACSVRVRALADEIVHLNDDINAALLCQAQEQGITVEHDTVNRPWQWLAWTPGKQEADIVDLVAGCRCRRYQTYRACEHHALVKDRHHQEQALSEGRT